LQQQVPYPDYPERMTRLAVRRTGSCLVVAFEWPKRFETSRVRLAIVLGLVEFD